MINREVIEKILAYHPHLPDYHGCDDWKCGDPDAECTGIVTALVPTIHVIEKAIKLGANLVIVHEPTFYTSEDAPGWYEDFSNAVYEEKRTLIDTHGITIWRDHDHMHANEPDSIFTGVIKYLGWEGHATPDFDTGSYSHYIIDIPEMTVAELCRHVISCIGINGVRYIGNPDAKVHSVAIVGHLFPEPCHKTRKDGSPVEYGVQVIRALEEKVDVILPGEIVEWTVLSYIRDAVQQGRTKAMINIGHLNWEELGMKYAQEWIETLVEQKIPVTYVPSEDMYQYIMR